MKIYQIYNKYYYLNFETAVNKAQEILTKKTEGLTGNIKGFNITKTEKGNWSVKIIYPENIIIGARHVAIVELEVDES